MTTNAPRAQEGPARPNESTQNHHVTARSVRGPDGTARTMYCVDGRDVGSLEDLESFVGSRE